MFSVRTCSWSQCSCMYTDTNSSLQSIHNYSQLHKLLGNVTVFSRRTRQRSWYTAFSFHKYAACKSCNMYFCFVGKWQVHHSPAHHQSRTIPVMEETQMMNSKLSHLSWHLWTHKTNPSKCARIKRRYMWEENWRLNTADNFILLVTQTFPLH